MVIADVFIHIVHNISVLEQDFYCSVWFAIKVFFLFLDSVCQQFFSKLKKKERFCVVCIVDCGIDPTGQGCGFFRERQFGDRRYFRVPALVIGLTIVAFGTSAPEAAVSITAAIKGQNGIAVGNVLGSNLFNLLGVVGICALIKPMNVDKGVIFEEYPFMILSGAALLALGADTFLGTPVPI